jgi:uncharacterized protein (TIGR00725 family)
MNGTSTEAASSKGVIMTRQRQIAVVGSSDDRMEPAVSHARELGELLALEGWTVLSGGRDTGVMRAVNEGAKRVAGSLTVGILPGAESVVAPGVDVVLVTGLGNARNNVIVLSADVVVACGVDGPGTASEVALALKNGTPVVLLAPDENALAFFRRIGDGTIVTAASPREAVERVRALLAGQSNR